MMKVTGSSNDGGELFLISAIVFGCAVGYFLFG
ncbi:MAG: hypothetical protein ACI9HU_000240 [Colwellia sp.]|jgi:hypothetical protein